MSRNTIRRVEVAAPVEDEINAQEYFYEAAYKSLEDKKARQERLKEIRSKKGRNKK